MIDGQTLTFQFSLSKNTPKSQWNNFHAAAEFILANSRITQFNERPGQIYLKFPSGISDELIQEAFSLLCNTYELEYNSAVRKSGMKHHYEIKGSFIELFKNAFAYPTEALIIKITRKLDYMAHSIYSGKLKSGEVKTYASKPGNTYLDFTNSTWENEDIIQAFKTICSLYGFEHTSFRQAEKPHHFQISEELFKLYNEDFPIKKPIVAFHSLR